MSNNFNILCTRLEIKSIGKNKEEEYYINKKLWDWRYKSFIMSNKIMNRLYFNDDFKNRILDVDYEKIKPKTIKKLNKLKDERKITKDKKIIKELDKKIKIQENILKLCYKEAREKAVLYYGCSEQNTGYSEFVKIYPNVPSYIRSVVSKKVFDDYKIDRQDVKLGNKTRRNYKKCISVPFMSSAITDIYEKENKFYIKLFGFNFLLVGCHKDNRNKKVIEYILEKGKNKRGIYIVLSNSSYSYNKKFFLNLSIRYEKKINFLDKSIIVGVDIGYRNLVYCGLNKGLERMNFGHGKIIHDYGCKVERIRKRKNSLINKGGRGRNNKLKSLYNLNNAKKNFVNTLCHVVSKKVIDFCKKNNAGLLYMELLEGLKKEKQNNFLFKNFPYYKLQMFIKYKAEIEGIEVKFVDPYHTSQICSVCGNYNKEQRKNMNEYFMCKNKECKNYEKKINADYNAAVNISNSKKYVNRKEECEYYKLKYKNNNL